MLDLGIRRTISNTHIRNVLSSTTADQHSESPTAVDLKKLRHINQHTRTSTTCLIIIIHTFASCISPAPRSGGVAHVKPARTLDSEVVSIVVRRQTRILVVRARFYRTRTLVVRGLFTQTRTLVVRGRLV